ncbi:uncharacterized protein LACBIDRAFT_293638 [Laccaria bicolor S238N-H82]|uniref:Predicted protein n=1 Tax=Laccaria bicolor (strain S238N-H82 / ATCC MYA-4686) TaxID=486041 RepID=B0D4T5_LACBS|nr:uncharacterized protein LACBIDRAFT_293638 [Laccaria bicolor S238N-H82]EDR10621.1 predicted protein [Laccaria bicolor S238N-H82]|eukprot:XP_001879071.1 predicted protein [Laccaria bicolor S238N-H82]
MGTLNNFLAEEERFWTQLVLRLRRSFAINEAQPALVALELIAESDESAVQTLEGGDGVGATPNGRNHFQFPPEDPNVSFAPTTPAERESHLAIFSKALVCLGDIARYREQQNEGGGRPRAGHEDGPARRGRSRRGGAATADIARPRNYDKAQRCYEQARLLVPHEGNASHQLAILASYQKDSFASLVHYYRALCVRQPYDTAAENLGTILNKVLETWKARTRRERENKNMAADQQIAPRVRIETFKERLVVLHALWRVGLEKGIEKMDSISKKHDKVVFNDFQSLVAQRHLPTDMISSAIVLSQGALWKLRMVHDTPSHNRKQETRPPPAGTFVVLEWRILNHLLDLHCALLEVGKDELKDLPPMDAVDNDLAQRISATFRRMLPALRIASKWLQANFKYVMQDREFQAFQENEKAQGLEPSAKSSLKLSAKSGNTIRFWKAYAQFNLALSQAFPIHKIPQLAAPLEEDVEMRGFLPLKQLMGEQKTFEDGGKPTALGQVPEQVHPNVEQLMRIRDLLDDSIQLAHVEHLKNSPLILINNHILFRAEIVDGSLSRSHSEATGLSELSIPPVPLHQQQLLADIRDARLDGQPDDDNMTEGTDVLREAFDFLHTDQPEDEDQDDEIVWDPRAPASPPTMSPIMQTSPITPVKAMMSPGLAPRSPPHQKTSSAPINQTIVPGTTAQDLLNNVMGVKRSESGGLVPISDPPPLQNSRLLHRPTQSIWSTSHDEQPLKMFSGNALSSHQIYQTPQSQHRTFPASSSQDMSPPIWSSSYPTASQNSQQTFVGALPSASFAFPPQTVVTNGHQRIPSASVAAQLFPSHAQHDFFGYAPPIPQEPIHRPESHAASPSGFMNHFGRGNEIYYDGLQQQQHVYHTQHPSMHDPRVKPAFVPPPISQVWGNVG